jgi:hypothetical protein
VEKAPSMTAQGSARTTGLHDRLQQDAVTLDEVERIPI